MNMVSKYFESGGLVQEIKEFYYPASQNADDNDKQGPDAKTDGEPISSRLLDPFV
jgi:hypothetical protein